MKVPKKMIMRQPILTRMRGLERRLGEGEGPSPPSPPPLSSAWPLWAAAEERRRRKERRRRERGIGIGIWGRRRHLFGVYKRGNV